MFTPAQGLEVVTEDHLVIAGSVLFWVVLMLLALVMEGGLP